MSRGERINRYFGGNPKFRIESMRADGDCFYQAIVAANTGVGEYEELNNILKLREIVSERMEPSTFDTYMVYCSVGIEGYTFMNRIADVDQLKALVKQSGRDKGIADCVWADAFAVQAISDALNITLLIINENNLITQTTIIPSATILEQNDENERSSAAGKRKQDGSFQQQQINDSDNKSASHHRLPRRYIVLQLTRRGHYNLVRYDGIANFSEDSLPLGAKLKFHDLFPGVVAPPLSKSSQGTTKRTKRM